MSNSRFGFRSRKGEIRSFIEGNVALPNDVDAQAFINAAGITDPTQQSAINTLVVNLKSQSLWTKFLAIYPFVGGTASTHKFNLLSPLDLSSAYRLSFLGGWTHGTNGITGNGTNAYANTFLAANSIVNTSWHLSLYSRTLTVGNSYEIGAIQALTGSPQAMIRAGRSFGFGLNANTINYATNTDARGFWIGTKRANNDREGYRNGASEVTSTTNDTNFPTTANIYIGAMNDSNTTIFGGYSTKEIAFASIGIGLTDTEASNFYTAVQAFQTILGRQI